MGRVSVREISRDMPRDLYDERLEAVMNEVKGMSLLGYFGKYEVETGEHELRHVRREDVVDSIGHLRKTALYKLAYAVLKWFRDIRGAELSKL